MTYFYSKIYVSFEDLQKLNHLGDGDLSGEGQDVGAGDDARADVLDGGLDVVHHVEAPDGVPVRRRVFLGLDASDGVQQDGGVATLEEPRKNPNR